MTDNALGIDGIYNPTPLGQVDPTQLKNCDYNLLGESPAEANGYVAAFNSTRANESELVLAALQALNRARKKLSPQGQQRLWLAINGVFGE